MYLCEGGKITSLICSRHFMVGQLLFAQVEFCWGKLPFTEMKPGPFIYYEIL